MKTLNKIKGRLTRWLIGPPGDLYVGKRRVKTFPDGTDDLSTAEKIKAVQDYLGYNWTRFEWA